MKTKDRKEKCKHVYIPVEWKDVYDKFDNEVVGYTLKSGSKVVRMNCQHCESYALESSHKLGFNFYENST